MSLLERRPGTENTPTMGGGRMEGDMGGGWKSNGITEAGGRWCSGAKISFYGRVTNLRTRHCRVPADGRTMRLRNTMLHSGNLKAVLTTNLQPPRTTTLCAPLDLPSPCVYQCSLLRHVPSLSITQHAAIPSPRLYFLILSNLTGNLLSLSENLAGCICFWNGKNSK